MSQTTTPTANRSKQPIQIEDLYELVIPAGLAATREGHAVWSEKSITEGSPRKVIAHLVSAPIGGAPRPLTESGAHFDSGAAISPNGKTVAFLRRRLGDPPLPTELCAVPLAGGEVRVLARERGDFSGLAWSPDSQSIAFSFRRADALPEGASAPLAIRVNRAHYKLDGYGYFPVDRQRIYLIAAGGLEPIAIETPLELGDRAGAWDDTDPVFSPDGSELAFLTNRRDGADLNQENRDLYVAPLAGGAPRCCTEKEGPLMCPVWAPSGAWIAALGCFGPPGTMLMRAQVGLVSIDPSGQRGERLLSAELDQCLMNLVIDDLWGLEEWAQAPLFVNGGAEVLLPISARGTTSLASFPVDGDGLALGAPRVVIGDRIVVSLAGGDTLCALTSSATEPGVVVRRAIDADAIEPVAAPTLTFLSGRAIAEPVEMTVEGDDGVSIQAWIYLPQGAGPHPLLLNIHGGPVVQFGTGFFHEVQTFVAAGFAVLHVNPHGSQGYGLAFCNAIARDWASQPHRDLSAALDQAIARFPIDASRLGVMGGSYGGYMTNWMIGHTKRFKAACTQRTVSQLDAMIWSDFGFSFGDEIGSWAWDDPDHYSQQSPITYAKDIETPLLILQGLADHRTPADQGERLFATLRVLGKDVAMVLFPGADHGLSRGGKPEQRVERLRIIHEWFAERL